MIVAQPRRAVAKCLCTTVLAVLATLALGCGSSEEHARTSRLAEYRRAPKVDSNPKQRLYGDPGLVPSRVGERARAELLLELQVERFLSPMPDIEQLVVAARSDSPRPGGAMAIELSLWGAVHDLEARREQISEQVLRLAPGSSLVLSINEAQTTTAPIEVARIEGKPTGSPVGRVLFAIAHLIFGAALGAYFLSAPRRRITKTAGSPQNGSDSTDLRPT